MSLLVSVVLGDIVEAASEEKRQTVSRIDPNVSARWSGSPACALCSCSMLSAAVLSAVWLFSLLLRSILPLLSAAQNCQPIPFESSDSPVYPDRQ